MFWLIIPRLFLFELFKIGSIYLSFNFRCERSVFFSDSFPINSLEKGMSFYFRNAVNP